MDSETKLKIAEFQLKQRLPYEAKIAYVEKKSVGILRHYNWQR